MPGAWSAWGKPSPHAAAEGTLGAHFLLRLPAVLLGFHTVASMRNPGDTLVFALMCLSIKSPLLPPAPWDQSSRKSGICI